MILVRLLLAIILGLQVFRLGLAIAGSENAIDSLADIVTIISTSTLGLMLTSRWGHR